MTHRITTFYQVSRGGRVFAHGRWWKAWPWSRWAKVTYNIEVW